MSKDTLIKLFKTDGRKENFISILKIANENKNISKSQFLELLSNELDKAGEKIQINKLEIPHSLGLIIFKKNIINITPAGEMMHNAIVNDDKKEQWNIFRNIIGSPEYKITRKAKNKTNINPELLVFKALELGGFTRKMMAKIIEESEKANQEIINVHDSNIQNLKFEDNKFIVLLDNLDLIQSTKNKNGDGSQKWYYPKFKQYDQIRFDVPINPAKRRPKTITNSTWYRDPAIKNISAKRDGYLCVIDNEHFNFKMKNGNNYTESHHLVMMNNQPKTQTNLDILENVVSLCANCHRQIHYGENKDVKQMLNIIFDYLKDVEEKTGFSHAEIKKMYLK